MSHAVLRLVTFENEQKSIDVVYFGICIENIQGKYDFFSKILC